jgi:hypothetical protein
MKSRLAIHDPEIPNDPHKSPPACLELSPKSLLSVTNVVTGSTYFLMIPSTVGVAVDNRVSSLLGYRTPLGPTSGNRIGGTS